jgi:uncharacterized membrane protein YfcA
LNGGAGGKYGIGGGSLLAPVLLAMGLSAYEVTPATLAATFLAAAVGVATYEVRRRRARKVPDAVFEAKRRDATKGLRRDSAHAGVGAP